MKNFKIKTSFVSREGPKVLIQRMVIGFEAILENVIKIREGEEGAIAL